MFLVGHGAVGALLATHLTKNPVVAFGIGWLSHYIVDFFPHGDESLGAWTKKGNEVLRLLVIVSIDATLLLASLVVVFSTRGFSWVALAGAFGACVPDVMWGLEKLFKRNLFGRFDIFHNRNHNFLHISLPLWFGIFGQILITFALWRIV